MSAVRAQWRRELLYPILALMEICWFYAWLTFLVSGGLSRSLSFVTALSVLLLATYLTRLLHGRKTPLRVQRSLTLLLAVLSSLLLLRLHIYASYRISDLSWLGSFLWEAGSVMQRISPDLILFCAGLYLWARGIALAQRNLDVESVGFSFRLGIAAFVWLFLLRIFSPSGDIMHLVFGFFFLGLVAVGLARIESVSQSYLGIRSPFNASWLAILAGSTVAMAALSIAAAALFSLRNVVAVLNAIKPVFALLGRLASPLWVALAAVLELLITFLIRIFSRLFGEQSEDITALQRMAEELQQFQQSQPAQGLLQTILQVIKWGALGLAFLGVLALVASSISRVRRALEENAEQEAVWESVSAAEDTDSATQSRWQRLRDELEARLARLRGEDYSLASIRKVYASLARLATACGFPRREAETPYEYTSTLHRAFAGCEAEVQLITEAYVRVHYGERSFPPAYVQRVRDAWLAIRARQEQGTSEVQST
jgi:hypothetical protein